ncbi:unnamed protein product [Moneuplotes crassus]|uniref:NOA1/YqeH-like C-terminal domain-containing protein n=2 Tax=Euplotes crassus TaxID=5936 RepID=A0AAD1Y6H8_EUPCR|nr:unnamed protein product [Moneuplotes crassus]
MFSLLRATKVHSKPKYLKTLFQRTRIAASLRQQHLFPQNISICRYYSTNLKKKIINQRKSEGDDLMRQFLAMKQKNQYYESLNADKGVDKGSQYSETSQDVDVIRGDPNTLNMSNMTEDQRSEIDELLELENEVSDLLKGVKKKEATGQFLCEGCGVGLQHDNKDTLGFVEKTKFYKNVKHNYEREQTLGNKFSQGDKQNIYEEIKENFGDKIPLELKKALEKEIELQQNDVLGSSSVSEVFKGKEVNEGDNQYVQHNLETMLELEDLELPTESDLRNTMNKTKRRPLICNRCNALRFQHKLLTPQKHQKDIKLLSDFVLDFDHKGIMDYIKKHIHYRDIIIKIVDITDFQGTIMPEIFEVARHNKNHLILVVNKVDCLPKHVSFIRTQKWIRSMINPLTEDIKLTVCQTSAKTGYGLSKIAEILDKIKKIYVVDRVYRRKPKIYVMGCTNSGKSSFLNQLISYTTKNKEKRSKGKRGKTLYDREKQFKERGMNKDNRLMQDLLTVSPIPGTTMDFIEVADLKYGLKIYDTPGVPNPGQVISRIEDYQDAIQALNNQKIMSLSYEVKSGYSVWLGALARIDFLSGERKNFTFFVSPHVTIHRTPFDKADSVYESQAGLLLRPTYTSVPEETEFVSHDIDLKLESGSQAGFDIAISGLGWVSLTGKGFIQLRLRIPKEIKFSVRPPLMPFEVNERGLSKYTGNTVNANSKKNIKGRERFLLRKKMEEEAISKIAPAI